jgi:hypothetical protein
MYTTHKIPQKGKTRGEQKPKENKIYEALVNMYIIQFFGYSQKHTDIRKKRTFHLLCHQKKKITQQYQFLKKGNKLISN